MDRLWVPPGTRKVVDPTPPRVPLPVGNIILADHRVLRYYGQETLTLDGQSLTLSTWYGPRKLKVLASLDAIPERGWGKLLHISLSYPRVDPTWTDIRMVRAAFFGDTVDVAMILPRPEHYVNLHEHAFHLWETPESWGIM